MSDSSYQPIRSNVSLLGRLLGETIAHAEGDAFLELIELVRLKSKSAHDGDAMARDELRALLREIPDSQLAPLARAFSQFLSLANVAEQQHQVSRGMDSVFSATEMLTQLLQSLEEQRISGDVVDEAFRSLKIDLVLTAHPTEVTRRTHIHKHAQIRECLNALELSGHTPKELERIYERLRVLISQIWHSLDFREEKPGPLDEVRWGFAVVEDSLWRAVPEFMRKLDGALQDAGHAPLVLDAAPVGFVFWMGSDRDGNPSVTAEVTERAILLAHWQAADLYLRDINRLMEELSMSRCNADLAEKSGNAREPYRNVLKGVRGLLTNTLQELEARLSGGTGGGLKTLQHIDQILQPLCDCYYSLLECGMHTIANQDLLDTVRRAQCFGVSLVRFDIRQESSRHLQVLDELTAYLRLGRYSEWSEQQRVDFLKRELDERRPLLPTYWSPSAEAQEVLDTCKMISRQEESSLGVYIISMASTVSDILAVKVLLKACGCDFEMPVGPLFETLEDLEGAPAVIQSLLSLPEYKRRINNRQMVMIGYSDSSKDASVLTASWAQYRAQEDMLAVCDRLGVDLELFHGRGGTVGRGGAPAMQALLSQPPGTLRLGLRVTEQGEMIRAKMGSTSLAGKTLALYTSAIVRANLLEPPAPEEKWRSIMDKLAFESCEKYRAVVQGRPDFVEYFQFATPLEELGTLPLGSRPARRKTKSGLNGLRAIPWIFAWMQNRLLLPAWLGFGSAVRKQVDAGQTDTLRDMCKRWPFFSALVSMQEMLFEKIDEDLSSYYEERLVPAELHVIGSSLRALLAEDRATLSELLGERRLSAEEEWRQQSIDLRNVYTEPLHYLQVESLDRLRSRGGNVFQETTMISIAGIAAGMRNTG